MADRNLFDAPSLDELRAEMRVMRRGIEELHAAVDGLPATDHGETIAWMEKTLQAIAKTVDEMAKVTGAYLPPGQLEREMVRARQEAVEPLKRELWDAREAMTRAAGRLDEAVGHARSVHQQGEAVVRGWLWGLLFGAIAVVMLGILFPNMVIAVWHAGQQPQVELGDGSEKSEQ